MNKPFTYFWIDMNAIHTMFSTADSLHEYVIIVFQTQVGFAD